MNPFLIPRFNVDYKFADFLCAIRAILRIDGDEGSFCSLFGGKKTYFTTSGRTALYALLRSLNLPPLSRIGVPLYSCPSVFDAIIQAGYRPHFLDINFENYTLDPTDIEKKCKDIHALVVIHTFGRPAQMDRILEMVDVPIIEDCAHSLLSRYKEKATGTMGDGSIFSFRSGKYISAGEGGMIIINNKRLEKFIQEEVEKLSDPKFKNEFKHAAFVYIKSLLYHPPWYGMFARDIGVRLDDKMNISGKQGFKAEKIKRSDLAVFLRKFSTFESLVEKQRKNSMLLIEELKNTDLILPFEAENTYCNYYLFPVLFNTQEARNIAHERLKKLGVDTAKLFSETPGKARLYYGYKEGCPNTEEIGRRILTIPNFYTLNEDEILKIAEKVREVI